jgi:hypothetical protein
MSIPEPSPNELLRLWESGVPLGSAWQEFADSFVLTVLHTPPEKDPLVFGLHNRLYKDAAKAWVPETAEGREKMLDIVRRDAQACLVSELHAGRRWAIGFHSDSSGSREAIRISRQLFSLDESGHSETHRSIDWSKNAISTGTSLFIDIHVIRPQPGTEEALATATAGTAIPDDAASPAGMHETSSPEGQTSSLGESSKERNSPGRPSVATDVLAAIAHHAKTDPNLKRPRHERHENYRSYLASQTKDPQRYKNISEKTLEKYEREFLGKSSARVPIKGL